MKNKSKQKKSTQKFIKFTNISEFWNTLQEERVHPQHSSRISSGYFHITKSAAITILKGMIHKQLVAIFQLLFF